jgi:hypothetical protein
MRLLISLAIIAFTVACSDEEPLPEGIETNRVLAASIDVGALFDPDGVHEGTHVLIHVSDREGGVTDAIVTVDDVEIPLDEDGVFSIFGLPFMEHPHVSITRGDDFIRVGLPPPLPFTLEVDDELHVGDQPTVTWTPANDTNKVMLATIDDAGGVPVVAPELSDPGEMQSPRALDHAGTWRFSLTKSRHASWAVVFEHEETLTTERTQGALCQVDVTRTTYVDRVVSSR